MPDKKIETGQRMLELRKSQKKSQAEVAEYLKLTVAAYQNYEAGRREAGYETLAKLADFYGVTTDHLLGRSDEKPEPVELLTSEEFEQELLKEYFSLPDNVRSEIRNMMKQAVIRSENRRNNITLKENSDAAIARSSTSDHLPAPTDAQEAAAEDLTNDENF